MNRENHYVVLKESDIANLPTDVHADLCGILFRVDQTVSKRVCVVVEADWPEYELVWAAIKARTDGDRSDLDIQLRTLQTMLAPEPDPTLADLTETQCFILDAAGQYGFEIADDNATLYQVTDRQIVAFVEAVIRDTRAKMQAGA